MFAKYQGIGSHLVLFECIILFLVFRFWFLYIYSAHPNFLFLRNIFTFDNIWTINFRIVFHVTSYEKSCKVIMSPHCKHTLIHLIFELVVSDLTTYTQVLLVKYNESLVCEKIYHLLVVQIGVSIKFTELNLVSFEWFNDLLFLYLPYS